MNVFKIVISMMLFSATGVFADMVDDFEDGDYRNYLGFNWFYTMIPCDSEVIINNITLVDLGGFGMLPVAGIGYDEGYAAELSWNFGSKPDNCSHGRLVSLTNSLCFDSQGYGVGWYNATRISFYAKASTTLTVRVQLIIAGEPMANFYKDIEVTPEWARYTVPFSELVIDETSEPVEFQAAVIRKLQFIVMEDFSATPESGVVIIDDVEVDDNVNSSFIDVSAVETSKPGKSSEHQGILLADFEGNDLSGNGPEISRFETPWYLFDDSEKAGAGNSVFTDGITVSPEDSAALIQINIGDKDGFDSSQGLKVSFKLGNPIRDEETITQPFVGIGCMLSNSGHYFAGADTSLQTADLSEATGIYFDYRTVSDNPKFRHFTFELYDMDSLPEGNSYHKEIPATGGEWWGVVIPFANLDQPKDFDSLTGDQRSMDWDKIDRIQFVFQNVKETEYDVYFDNVKFIGKACGPYGCEQSVLTPFLNRHSSFEYIVSRNSVKILLNSLPGGTHEGYAELIGLNGEVVSRERLNSTGNASLLMKTGNLSAGVYILRVNTLYESGKIFSFTGRVSVLY